jgi:hypothetical protein
MVEMPREPCAQNAQDMSGHPKEATMPMQPCEHDDDFLLAAENRARSRREGWLLIVGAPLALVGGALGVGGGMGWAIATFGPETAFDMTEPMRQWALSVGGKCPSTSERIRQIDSDGRITRSEFSEVKDLADAARDVCEVPRIPSDD